MSAPSASKSDLIDALIEKHLLDQTTAKVWIDIVLDGIREVSSERRLIIRGFGTFEVKHKPARTARNVRTGLPVDVPARDVLTFKAAKAKA
jgi:DNA-binding protein HU-beta